jgi:hypothetical protein
MRYLLSIYHIPTYTRVTFFCAAGSTPLRSAIRPSYLSTFSRRCVQLSENTPPRRCAPAQYIALPSPPGAFVTAGLVRQARRELLEEREIEESAFRSVKDGGYILFGGCSLTSGVLERLEVYNIRVCATITGRQRCPGQRRWGLQGSRVQHPRAPRCPHSCQPFAIVVSP